MITEFKNRYVGDVPLTDTPPPKVEFPKMDKEVTFNEEQTLAVAQLMDKAVKKGKEEGAKAEREKNKSTLINVKYWIKNCNSIHSLKSIKSKTEKRISYLKNPNDISPFKNIPVKVKRRILKPLFYKEEELKKHSGDKQ